MTSDIASLYCRDIFLSFGGIQALNGISLEFADLDVFAVIGPNGAGKTTLLNALTGFIRPDRGHCYLGDQEITSLSPHEIARMGVVRSFQNLRLIKQISVIENVLLARPAQSGERFAYAMFDFGLGRRQQAHINVAKQILDFVGLSSKSESLAGELSYGQQKLLVLACCLATDAHTILLDEPFAGVHPALIDKILNLLRSLRAEGKRIVFVEHNLLAVRHGADIVIVLDQGQIIATGQPAEVLARPEILEAYVA